MVNKHGFRQARPFAAFAMAAALSLSLAGCETFQTATKTIAASNTQTDKMMNNLDGYAPAPDVSVHNSPFLLGTEISPVTNLDGTSDPLFTQHFALDTSKPLTLDQLASLITQQTGIPVNVTSQVDGFLNGQKGSDPVPMPPLPGQVGNVNAPQFSGVSTSQNQLNLSYDGTLGGLLNLVASRSGTFWKFENGTVEFFLTETKTFDIDALPGTATFNSSISNAGNTGQSTGAASNANSSTTGSTQQTAGLSASLDLYTSIQNSITTILAETASAGGSGTSLNVPTSVAVDQEAGQLVVTATPPELQAVANFIAPLNQELQKNVLIDLHVYSVQLNGSNNYGLNLAAAFNQVASRYGLSFSSVQAPTIGTGGGSLSAAILSAPAAGQGGLTTGTSGVVQALATQGNVSLVTDGSVIALNGQPTPLQVAQNKGYLASSSTTTTVNAGTSATLTPGSYTIGFSGTFLPLIRGDSILLEYNVNLTQDLGLQTLSADGSEIQLPQTADQSFMQRVALKSGETLVLSGFEQQDDTTTNNGTGDSNFFLLGGGRSAQADKQALVVVIHVVDMGS
jgi:type IVB pilus formation R64 PilN family outer membrane protein